MTPSSISAEYGTSKTVSLTPKTGYTLTGATTTCKNGVISGSVLTISNITASFVIGDMGDKICISGRSIGDINVQVILEKLGGGGHITLAGAQLENMTIEEAKTELIIRINEYFTEV